MLKFSVINKSKKNFTPSRLIIKYAVERSLPIKTIYGRILVKIDGNYYEYDHYELDDLGEDENVTVYLTPYKCGCYGSGSYACMNHCSNCEIRAL